VSRLSILKTRARRVLRYFNKYGFSNIKLTIYIVDEKSTKEQVIELEQYFIDNLKPNLNVDLVASSSGYHEPMSHDIVKNYVNKEEFLFTFIVLKILLYYIYLNQNNICIIQ